MPTFDLNFKKNSSSPVDCMTLLAARVIADFNMTFMKLYSNVVIVPIVQKNAIVLCRGHL